MEEAYIYSNHSKIHKSSVATSNPNKNGFSSPLSWRAQAYKMENGRERDTKRKMELFPQALTLLQALQIALLELQNVQDEFPSAKTEEKGSFDTSAKTGAWRKGLTARCKPLNRGQVFPLPPGVCSAKALQPPVCSAKAFHSFFRYSLFFGTCHSVSHVHENP